MMSCNQQTSPLARRMLALPSSMTCLVPVKGLSTSTRVLYSSGLILSSCTLSYQWSDPPQVQYSSLLCNYLRLPRGALSRDSGPPYQVSPHHCCSLSVSRDAPLSVGQRVVAKVVYPGQSPVLREGKAFFNTPREPSGVPRADPSVWPQGSLLLSGTAALGQTPEGAVQQPLNVRVGVGSPLRLSYRGHSAATEPSLCPTPSHRSGRSRGRGRRLGEGRGRGRGRWRGRGSVRGGSRDASDVGSSARGGQRGRSGGRGRAGHSARHQVCPSLPGGPLSPLLLSLLFSVVNEERRVIALVTRCVPASAPLPAPVHVPLPVPVPVALELFSGSMAMA